MMKQSLLGVVIETKRLRIEAISVRHSSPIFQTYADTVAQYFSLEPFETIAEVAALIPFYRREMMGGDSLRLVAIHKETGTFIGCAGMDCLGSEPRLSAWIKVAAWGQGYGFEIMTALKRWADEHLEYEYLLYPVAKDNLRSRRIAEKLGGHLGESEVTTTNVRGESMVMVEYRIKRA